MLKQQRDIDSIWQYSGVAAETFSLLHVYLNYNFGLDCQIFTYFLLVQKNGMFVQKNGCLPSFYLFFEVHANHVDHVSSVFEFALENNLDTKYGYFEIKRINAERGAMVRVVTYSGFAFWVKKNLVKGRKVWKAWKRLSGGEKGKCFLSFFKLAKNQIHVFEFFKLAKNYIHIFFSFFKLAKNSIHVFSTFLAFKKLNSCFLSFFEFAKSFTFGDIPKN